MPDTQFEIPHDVAVEGKMEAIRATHAYFDRVWGFLKQHQPPISCKRGCHGCCSEPVYVNYGEVELAVQSIKPQDLDYVTRQTANWVKIAKESGLLKQEQPHVLDWLKMQLPCPFLRGGECVVYEARPISCRAHNALDDAALCHTLEGRKRQRYATWVELNMAATNMLAVVVSSVHDHLGVFLAAKLLGSKVESAATVSIEFSKDK